MNLRRCAPLLVLLFLFAFSGSGQLIDDFESYVDTADLQTVWHYGDLDTTTPNPGSGTQSLYRGGVSGPGSGTFDYMDFGSSVDLSGETVSIMVRRDPGSVVPTGVFVGVRDVHGVPCSINYVMLTDSEWHELVHDLTDPNCDLQGLDPTVISRVEAHVTNFGEGDPMLTAANFDDLRHYLHRGGFESGDFTGWIVVAGST